MSGFFITMEGVDGSGKSEQSKMLFEYLKSKGHDVILTREPGGTAISEKIRDIILDKSNSLMSKMTEALLYAAARSQTVSELIVPALLDGKIVISDRFLDSSLVYQGIARGLGVDNIEIVNSFATKTVKADITFLLDLRPNDAHKRKLADMAKLDRLELEPEDFHEKVYYGYRQIAEKYSDRIRIIDAARPKDIIHEQIIGILKNVMKGELL